MLEVLWAAIGGVIGLFLKEKKPHQIALAIALGVMLGLVPKVNLIALMLVLTLFLTRCNLGFGILTAALVSLAMPRLYSVANSLGGQLLARPSVIDLETTLFQYPLFAWTALNNTVVLGSVALGIIAFLPVYLISFGICRLASAGNRKSARSRG